MRGYAFSGAYSSFAVEMHLIFKFDCKIRFFDFSCGFQPLFRIIIQPLARILPYLLLRTLGMAFS